MTRIRDLVLAADAAILVLMLFGAAWSVAYPAKRVWPPPSKGSWQRRLTWVLFYAVFGFNAILFVVDWNRWIFDSNLRFVLGVPLAVLGGLLVSWGIATLGTQNTSGVKDRFVSSGPYAFSRNPQYLGDMTLFVGLSLIANSMYLWIVHLLLIAVFVVTSLAEESWLEEQYGGEYANYRCETSRFL